MFSNNLAPTTTQLINAAFLSFLHFLVLKKTSIHRAVNLSCHVASHGRCGESQSVLNDGKRPPFSRSSRPAGPSVSPGTEAPRAPAEAGRINVVLTITEGTDGTEGTASQHFGTWREKRRGKGEASGVIESQPLELLIRC